MARLDAAIDSLRLSIDDMLSRGDIAVEGEHRDILEAYRMFANDRGWVRRLDEAIATASPPRPRSRRCRTTRARACSARPIPISATGCTISTISPTGCCAC